MTSVKEVAYRPDPARAAAYERLYSLYLRLHDSFGGAVKSADLSGVMKDLIAIKNEANNVDSPS